MKIAFLKSQKQILKRVNFNVSNLCLLTQERLNQLLNKYCSANNY